MKIISKLKEVFKEAKPEKIALILGTLFVLGYTFIIPPLNGFDEATHFLRAYQISEGKLLPERFGPDHAGGKIPVNISQMSDAAVDDIIQSAKTNLARKTHIRSYAKFLLQFHPSSSTVDKYFAGSSVYSPISYTPQAVGIFIARNLHLPLLLYVYAGRIINALIFLTLVYLAIKLSPTGKWVLLAVAMLPTTLTAAASLSPDSIINGVALLLVALFLKALFSKNIIKIKQLLIIASLIIILSLTKQTYFILVILPFFLPISVFGNWRRYISWNLIFVALALVATFGWYSQISDIARISYLETRPTMHINSGQQISFIIHHFFNYVSLLSWQILGHFNPQYVQIVGFLTWKGIVMPQPIIFLAYLGLILAFLMIRLEKTLKPKLLKLQHNITSYGPILLGFVTMCLVYTTLYIAFNAVGNDDIEGVQGRYLIPLIALFIPLIALSKISKTSIKLNYSKVVRALAIIIITQNTVGLFIIFATNYIPHMQFV